MYDYETVKGWAERAITERGSGYVYPRVGIRNGGCVYVEQVYEGGLHPSCIIGVMLFNAGLLPMETFYRDTTLNASRIGFLLTSAGGGNALGDAMFTRKAIRFMSILQSRQDQGKTWGDALAGAMEAIENQTDWVA